MFATFAAYLLVCIYLGSDAHFRTGAQARSHTPDESDRRSTRYIGFAVLICVLALLGSLPLNHFGIGRLPNLPALDWLGVMLMALGIGLRVWSTQVLGRFYTRTLLTTADHRIVQEGPYWRVRHPGYTGSLLVWIGAGLATGNWIVLGVIALACALSYGYRMHSEEALLVARFGPEYTAYMRRTRRLIPFLY